MAGGRKRREASRPVVHGKFRLRAVMLVLFLAAGALYLPTLRHAFVFDDEAHISGNAVVLRGLGGDGFRWAFTTLAGTSWHPLTWLSYMAGVELFGPGPGPQHAIGLVLHAVTSALAMLVCVRMTGAFWRSAAVAALFALHPLHVESVAYAAERKDVLYALFWMGALAAYVRFARRPGAAAYGVVVGCYALSLMAKPMAVTLPLVLLVLDVWPLGRLRGGRGLAPLRARLIEKAPLLALSAAVSALTLVGGRQTGVLLGFEVLPFVARLENAAMSAAIYLVQTVWPARLAAFYPLPPGGPPVQVWVPSLLLLAGLTALAVRERCRRPWLAAGWAWYLVTLLPVSGLVQIGYYAHADRYTYVPLLGIFVIAAWGAGELFSRLRLGTTAIAAVSLLVLGSLAAVANFQVGHWRDPVALFGRALAVTEGNWLAHYGLGQALEVAGEATVAEEHYRLAVGLNPGYKEARNNLGVLLGKRGDFAGALVQFREALKVRPRAADVHANLALTLELLGRHAEAAVSYRRSLELEPRNPVARAALERLARSGEAPPSAPQQR